MRAVADVVMYRYRGWIGIVCLGLVAAAVLVSTPRVSKDSLADSFFDMLACGCAVLSMTFR